MKRLILLICLLLMTTFGSAARQSRTDLKGSFVITHANVIDGVSSAPIKDATVIVREGKIEKVATGNLEVPEGTAVIDLKGKWLLPGFVDAHAHLADMSAARRALASGATTVRCLGVNHFVDIGFRELNHAGVADLPDVVAAGYHVRPRPAEEFFLDMPKMRDLMNGVS